MNALENRLLNDFQRDLPLCPAPFAHIGEVLGLEQAQVIDALSRLKAEGKISRVGAVFRPNSVSASTLAAMQVPKQRLDEVADMVSACPAVSHNYARAYSFNLWFVVTARNEPMLENLLDDLQRKSGCSMLRLPLVESYHIDLGFDLGGSDGVAQPARRVSVTRHSGTRLPLAAHEARLADRIAGGLPFVPRPWQELATQADTTEDAAIGTVRRWVADGVITRFGVIVRHHELGFQSNAMVAFDIPDNLAEEAGLRIASIDEVTLCARRARSLPQWPYNVYCMIHGRDEARVLTQIEALRQRCGLLQRPFAVLFSRRRFKQQAARTFMETAHG
jgi:DNA-binding Lrp family transcriptional regulator